MPNLRRVTPALWIAAALCVALPAPASAAVTIGSNLNGAAAGETSCGSGCTFAHGVLPPASTASGGLLAPSDGVVVRWRIKVGASATPVALRITRPGNSNTRIGAGTGPTVTPDTNAISPFAVRLPIQAGDAIGIDCCVGGFLAAFAANPDAATRDFGPSGPLPDGGDLSGSSLRDNTELLINAEIEPDADNDGYGDETQDKCPTRPGDGRCPDTNPPQTTITTGAPNKLDAHKFKFKFKSSEERGATFECRLDKKPFKPCSSPKKVKHLDKGKHRFKVRAIDEAGNVDPSAAKDTFKVVD
jgi:hypothetical protein